MYNARALKNYNRTSSLVRFETKNTLSFYYEKRSSLGITTLAM
jgi:hypothetical protein